jgi:aromatic ring-opening dioxygenase LigB subunit
MNPFVFACMTPHGSEIIEALSEPNIDLMKTTRSSMERLGEWMTSARPEVLIVFTPHGLRLDGQFSVTDSERMYGEVEDHGAAVTMERPVDRDLAKAIVAAARTEQIPVGAVNYATSAGPLSCLPLDWGAVVPLSFMPNVPIVVITPSRLVAYDDHIRFGQVLAGVVRDSGKRVGLIASCDWSHAHTADGPYGFHPAAAALDKELVGFIQSNDLERMMELDAQFVEDAKPDGIWQTLMLAGAIDRADRHVEFLSYEVPTYFGLICAAYHQYPGK